MAEKTITLDELQRLKSEGAEVEIETEVLSIERFDELLEAVKQMAANEAERIRADIARNQTNLEILATLQAMVRKAGEGPKAQPVDLSPIRDLIVSMHDERQARDRGAYEFAIKRDGRGFAQTITATPVSPTTH